MAAEPERFRKVGLLTKLGAKVKNWQERGFALSASRQALLYFRSSREFRLFTADPQKHAKRIAGVIPLDSARVYLADYAENDHCMEVSAVVPNSGKPRHYYMYATSHNNDPEPRLQIISWVKALCSQGTRLVVRDTSNALLLRHVATSSSFPQPVFGIQGFLEKRGAFNKSFRPRFFRLEFDSKRGNHVLRYYKRYDDVDWRGEIDLKGATIEAETDESEEDRCQFAIQTGSGKKRRYILRSKFQLEKDRWLQSLERFVKDPERELHLVDMAPFIDRDVEDLGSSDGDPEDMGEVAEEEVEEEVEEAAEEEAAEEEPERASSSSSSSSGDAGAGADDGD